jgi:hypothetical protein
MNYVLRFMVVAAEHADLARSLSEALAGDAGKGMFSCPLSADGTEPTTHYLTEGWIEPQFAELMASPGALFAACQAAGAPVTSEQVDALLASAVVAESEGNPIAQAQALGLKIIQVEQAA